MAEETQKLAYYVAGLRISELPPEVVARAERLILDFVGNIVRGGHEAESSPVIRGLTRTLGFDGPGPCTVFGEEGGLRPAAAALLNGAFGHALDFDDTHAASSLHPSAPVVSAALAAAEMKKASGRDFVVAVVAGYEVCCRLGLALDSAAHYARGFHPTATAGTFGAAAAAGRLLGLDGDGIACAFGVAGSQAAGSLQFLVNGAWNKRYQVGAAAMNGLIAATLAAGGFKGAAAAIEGGNGFLKGYSGAADPSRVVQGLGTEYETMKIGVKLYPSCRYTHAALDGLLALRARLNATGVDIEKVEIGLHPNGIKLTAEPIAQKRRVRSVVAGQFSMPFTAAVALDQGRFGWDDYARIGDPALDALSDRIHVAVDPRVAALAHPFGASLRVWTREGLFEEFIPDPSGEPGVFPSDGLLKEKFGRLAAPVFGEARAERLAATLLSASELDRIATVAALARRPHAASA